MKDNILLVLLFFLIPIIINGQTQEATTSDGKKVILNADGTWKYAEEVTTSDGKRVILIADGTWKYVEKNIEKERVAAEQNRQVDIINRTRDELANSSGLGHSGISYSLAGRGVQKLPLPKYDYQGEGRVVVEVGVDRSGKVTQAVPGIKGSTTLDEYLLKVARDAALEAQFDAKPDAPLIQKGTITYIFALR